MEDDSTGTAALTATVPGLLRSLELSASRASSALGALARQLEAAQPPHYHHHNHHHQQGSDDDNHELVGCLGAIRRADAAIAAAAAHISSSGSSQSQETRMALDVAHMRETLRLYEDAMRDLVRKFNEHTEKCTRFRMNLEAAAEAAVACANRRAAAAEDRLMELYRVLEGSRESLRGAIEAGATADELVCRRLEEAERQIARVVVQARASQRKGN